MPTSHAADTPSYTRGALAAGLLLYLLLGLTYWVYFPGLSGSFLLDDFPNLRNLAKNLAIPDWERLFQFVLGGSSGPSGRPVSLLSFLLNDFSWPSEARPFKYTNVLLHLLNGVLVFWLTYLLVRIQCLASLWISAGVAICVSAIWILHPLNVSTVLYVIQRMTLLSSMFMLGGVILYIKGRLRLRAHPRAAFTYMTSGIVVCGTIGFLCKENAALLPLLVLVIEYTLLRELGNRRKRVFRIWQGIMLGGPILALLAWHIHRFPGLLAGYDTRPFTMPERLLSEARVMFEYLGFILIPRRAGTGLFHDDFPVSHGFLEPPATLVAILAIVALLVVAMVYARRLPVLCFGILWYFAAHSLEGTIVPLELYFEHRNYLAMLGPVLVLVYYLFELSKRLKFFSGLAISGFATLCALATWQNTTLWGDQVLLSEVWASEHPDSLRAQQVSADTWARAGMFDEAEDRIRQILVSEPDSASARLSLVQLNCMKGQPFDTELSSDITSAFARSPRDFAAADVIAILTNMVKTGQCPNLEYEHLHAWIDALLANQNFSAHGIASADLHYRKALISMAQRHYSETLAQLDAAMKRHANVDLALVKANVHISAGDFDGALAAVHKARQFDRNSLTGFPTRKREIGRWERYIIDQQKRLQTSDGKTNDQHHPALPE